MKHIDIYVLSDVKGVHEKRGRVAYMLEYRGRSITDLVSFEEHNLNGAALEGLLAAMRRVSSGDVEIAAYTDSRYVSSQINTGNIYRWHSEGYRTKEGVPIRYKELWDPIVSEVKEKCEKRIICRSPVPGRYREALEMRLLSRQ